MSSELPVSPLAPEAFPEMAPVDGIQLAVASAGIKTAGRPDVMFIAGDGGSVMAALFTRSKTASAAVHHSQKILAAGSGRAVLTNSGNANAFTGQQGAHSVKSYITDAGAVFGLASDQIMAASTGVIGELLEPELISSCLDGLKGGLGQAGWHDAAQAIRTTDTFAKGATASCIIDGIEVTVNGIAKGSGMIAPDMATMLAYIATDAVISKDCLQALLTETNQTSFNAITVDSDTSTSDSVFMLASQKAGNTPITDGSSESARLFCAALEQVMTSLALQIVSDGEGASKLITISVSGAASDEEARTIGMAIGNSPLVKTAIAGEDANWGRIVMAVGKSGCEVDRDRLSISIGGVLIAADGAAVSGYDETPVAAHMKGQHIDIDIDIGLKDGKARIYSCDLTHGYISINADYRS